MKSKKKDGSSHKHKHKKDKKQNKKRETSSGTESESDSMEWVEAPTVKPNTSHIKRDDWMNEELFVSTLSKEEMTAGSSSREKKKAFETQKMEKEEAIKRSRELNPHWKDNGSGLPSEERASTSDLRLPATSVGDGGYSFLRKAYQRIQEQAQEEGRSMEEIAVERWGSLSKLMSMIDEAEKRMKDLSKSRYSSHKSEDKSWHKKSSKSDQFRKPSGHSTSPEMSIPYRKPPDYERHRKKVNTSSSRDKKSSYYPPLQMSDDDEHDSSKSSNFASKTEKAFSETKWKKRFDDSDKDSSLHPKQMIGPKLDFLSAAGFQSESKEEKRVSRWKKPKPLCDEKKPLSYEEKHSGTSEDTEQPLSSQPQKPSSSAITSEDDLNRLASKYFKADLMGDKELASRLKVELEEARADFKNRKESGVFSAPRRETERVMLTKMDSSGLQRPVHSTREDAGFDRRSEKKQKKSSKYFEDTSKYSLKQMFEREKLTTSEDNLEMYLDVAAQAKEGDDENETSSISKKALQKMAHGVQEEKDIGKAIKQHQKLGAAVERCEYCFDQPNMKRHLIVSISEEVYLCIPNFQSLSEGHSLIVPKRHVPSFLHLDEDEWNEVEELKRLLRRFFQEQQKSLICLETSMFFGKFPHAIMECIPVPHEEGDMAPLYFKKAILESEEEWANNVKLVDLTKKGLRRSVPKNLPYFCVSFDPTVHAGYAHVIEDEKAFPRNFGKEVLGGMLDIDYNFLYKNRREDAVKKSNEALELTRSLEKFKEKSS